jgi:uncharacterized membrane protein YkvA (DUF1232 family)
MESFWEFAKVALIIGAVLIRKAFANLLFAIAGVLGIYIVSPIDFIPDIVPL